MTFRFELVIEYKKTENKVAYAKDWPVPAVLPFETREAAIAAWAEREKSLRWKKIKSEEDPDLYLRAIKNKKDTVVCVEFLRRMGGKNPIHRKEKK